MCICIYKLKSFQILILQLPVTFCPRLHASSKSITKTFLFSPYKYFNGRIEALATSTNESGKKESATTKLVFKISFEIGRSEWMLYVGHAIHRSSLFNYMAYKVYLWNVEFFSLFVSRPTVPTPDTGGFFFVSACFFRVAGGRAGSIVCGFLFWIIKKKRLTWQSKQSRADDVAKDSELSIARYNRYSTARYCVAVDYALERVAHRH